MSSRTVGTLQLAIAAALLALAVGVVIGAGSRDAPVPGPLPPRGVFVRSVAGERATLWAVGDGNAGAAGRAVAARIAAAPFHRLLYLGDVYEHGERDEFEHNFDASYGRLARRTAPTSGNHDWPNHETGYDAYWRRKLRADRTPGWYRFRAGGWTVLSLNSEAVHGAGSSQMRWLRRQLRSRGTCRLAFWHRPWQSAGLHGDQPDMEPIFDALRGRAAIVVSGHDHTMQRLRPVSGITQFVSGAGGESHYPVDGGDRRVAFGDDRLFGALRLRLRPGSASHAFVSSDGRVLDEGLVRCRR